MYTEIRHYRKIGLDLLAALNILNRAQVIFLYGLCFLNIFPFMSAMCDVSWENDKTYKLIGLLELSSELWNSTSKEYRDGQNKAKCKQMIAELLKMSTIEVNRKLNNFRCQMNSELGKIKNRYCVH